MTGSRHPAPHVGRKLLVFIFFLILLASVSGSELVQYVQMTLSYRQPFFLFYVAHSSLSFILFFHLMYLRATSSYTLSSLLKSLAFAISTHLEPGKTHGAFQFPFVKFLCRTLAFTIGLSIPGLLWYASVSLAPITDITAVWCTNAFFSYIISVKLFKLEWERKQLLAVGLATLGTFAVIYGGATASKTKPTDSKPSATHKPSAPVLGNLLVLIAAFGSGLYAVLYKMYGSLPSESDVIERQYEVIPADEGESMTVVTMDALYPPPFGLHSNLVTSTMGLFTFLLLWLPLLFLHWSGIEHFRLPPDKWTTLAVGCIALSSMVFNGGVLVLIDVLGPVVVCVGNLLSIVFILIADVIFGPGLEVVTVWSLLGSGGIVLAFAVLTYDMSTKKSIS